MERNTVFYADDGQPVFTGWLPEGYKASAKHEKDPEQSIPLVLWAYAQKDSLQWFYCLQIQYSYDRQQAPSHPFLPKDFFLHQKATELLGTSSIQVLENHRHSKATLQQLCLLQEERRKHLETPNPASSCRYVLLSQYRDAGSILFRANGNEKHLLVDVAMLGEEYGLCHAILEASLPHAKDEDMTSDYFSHGFREHLYEGDYIRSDPPFRRSLYDRLRSDGFFSHMIIWDILGYRGILSDSPFTKKDIQDFYAATNSLQATPSIMQKMSQITQEMQQGMKNGD